jgi:hypothetical protein
MTASEIADMKADFATARGEAADGIAEMKADVATAVDEARTATIDALAAEKNKVAQELSAQVAALTADIAQLVVLANIDRTAIINENTAAQNNAATTVAEARPCRSHQLEPGRRHDRRVADEGEAVAAIQGGGQERGGLLGHDRWRADVEEAEADRQFTPRQLQPHQRHDPQRPPRCTPPGELRAQRPAAPVPQDSSAG